MRRLLRKQVARELYLETKGNDNKAVVVRRPRR